MGVKANEEDTTNHRCEKASTRTQTLATWPAVASNRADNQAQAAKHNPCHNPVSHTSIIRKGRTKPFARGE